jgi:hypothetical protein
MMTAALPSIADNERYVNHILQHPEDTLLSRLSEAAIAQRSCQPICHCSAKVPSRVLTLGR